MSVQRPYFVVDAFAYEPFTGNPAAVVMDAAGLDDSTMARVAAEFNLSETTFITPGPRGSASGHSVRFRWFTPTVEVHMCGHATIAGLHALLEAGIVEPPNDSQAATVSIHTRSGVLTGFIERMPGHLGRHMIWLELIPPTLTPAKPPLAKLAEALGISLEVFDQALPPAETQDRDAIVFVRDIVALQEIAPDFHRLGSLLGAHRLRGLSVATVRTIAATYNVQSRFFAPTAGVDEDPVTGSVHGPLSVYLARQGCVPFHDGLAALTCGQAKPGGRGGVLHALVMQQPDASHGVRIGGRAITTMRGELLI